MTCLDDPRWRLLVAYRLHHERCHPECTYNPVRGESIMHDLDQDDARQLLLAFDTAPLFLRIAGHVRQQRGDQS